MPERGAINRRKTDYSVTVKVMRFTATFILLGSLVLFLGCSNPSDEVAELQAQLDSANAELTQLKASQEVIITNTTNGETSGKEFPETFGSGTWEVGVDIEAGTYVSRRDENVSFNNPFCSWERLSGLGGTISETITAGLTDGNAIVEIEPDDIGFTSIGCEEWVSR
tara:strand:+ start:486 stop:986 length:501 start_codon:yes stop_codon:yes gene_type:complete